MVAALVDDANRIVLDCAVRNRARDAFRSARSTAAAFTAPASSAAAATSAWRALAAPNAAATMRRRRKCAGYYANAAGLPWADGRLQRRYQRNRTSQQTQQAEHSSI